jgi:hypothetical protein
MKHILIICLLLGSLVSQSQTYYLSDVLYRDSGNDSLYYKGSSLDSIYRKSGESYTFYYKPVRRRFYNWNFIQNKPDSYASSSHVHAISDITSLQAALDAKGTSSFNSDYNSLINKPAIPTNTNELTNGSGFLTSETDPLAVKISDSAAMLIKYLRKQDTAAALVPYLRSNVAAATYQPIGSYVLQTTTVNGHALNGNVSVTASDLSLGNVTNTSDANKPVSTAQQTALDGKQATLVSNTNIKTVNGTSLLGSGDITQTTVSGNAGTATIFQTARLINGSSFNGSSDIQTNDIQLAYTALGSPVLAQTVGQDLSYCNTSTALVDGQIKYEAVYLPKAATLTGIKVYVRTLGSYTGDNNNRIGLYTYSAGTITLVASSANSASLWTSAANAIQTIPFSGTYTASAGLYFVGFIYNNSAQVTAPTLASGVALNNLAMGSTALGFTNSAKLHGTSSATDLPSSIAMSSITASTIPSWIALY